MKPSGKSAIVNYLLEKYERSIKLTCETIGLARSMWYYASKKDDGEVEAKLNEYAEQLPTYGFDEYYWRLRKEGYPWNRKRVLRVYRKMGLVMRRKRKRPYPPRTPNPLSVPSQPNQVWSMDFMSDSLEDGRRIRVFNVIDDYNREALATEVSLSFPAAKVVRILEQLIEERGQPNMIRTDNGSEFTAHLYQEWCGKKGIKKEYIKPGKPTQNAYVERFNKSFRKGVLSAYLFRSIRDLREKAEEWRYDYNFYHPHKSLGRKTPMELRANYARNAKFYEFSIPSIIEKEKKKTNLLNLELS